MSRRTIYVDVRGQDQLSGALRRAGDYAEKTSGKVRDLTHSLYATAAGFVGIGGLAWGLNESIKAGYSWQQAQRQLGQQIRGTKDSVRAATPYVDQLDQKFLKLGYTYSETDQALSYTIRATGNVSSGLKLAGLAADLARGRHIALGQAALVLGKVWDGNTTALKRLGVQIPANVSTQKALNIVQERFKGQANASATAIVQFRAVVGHLKETIGQALIPTVTNIVHWMEKYLASLELGGRRHAKFEQTLHQVEGALHQVIGAMKEAARQANALAGAVGGWGNAFKLIVGGIVAIKMLELSRSVAKVYDNMVELGTKSMKAAGTYEESTTSMEAATVGLSATIKSALISTAIGALVIAISFAAEYTITHWSKVKGWLEQFLTWLRQTWAATWAAVKDVGRAAVYAILQYSTAAFRGILEVASHLPFVGKHARAALDAIDNYINSWKPDFGNVEQQWKKAGEQSGVAYWKAFEKAHADLPDGRAGMHRVPPGVGGGSQKTKAKPKGTPLAPPSKPVEPAKKKHKVHIPSGDALLPAGIQIALAKAKQTKGYADDVKADQQAEAFLKKQLARQNLSIKMRIAYEKELAKIEQKKQRDLKKLHPKAKTPPSGTLALPLSIQQALAKAATTKGHADDLKADRQAETFLRKQLARTNLSKKARISDEKELASILAKKKRDLKAYQSEIKSIVAKANALYFKVDWKIGDALTDKFGKSQFDQVKDAMDKQWTAFFDNFDSVTQKGIDQINAKYDAPTPAEAALKALQDEHDSKLAAEKMADDQRALAAAMAGGGTAEIQDAQRNLDEDLYNQKVDDLTKKADAERAAAEQQRQIALDAYQKERDDLRAHFEDQQSAMDSWFDYQATQLQNGLETWKDFYAQLGVLAKDYGLSQSQGLGGDSGGGSGGGGGGSAPPPHGTGTSAQGGHVALASGGIVTSPTYALVGEGGEHEAVIPLSKLGRMLGGGGGAVHVHLEGPVIGADKARVASDLAEPLYRELAKRKKRNLDLPA